MRNQEYANFINGGGSFQNRLLIREFPESQICVVTRRRITELVLPLTTNYLLLPDSRRYDGNQIPEIVDDRVQVLSIFYCLWEIRNNILDNERVMETTQNTRSLFPRRRVLEIARMIIQNNNIARPGLDIGSLNIQAQRSVQERRVNVSADTFQQYRAMIVSAFLPNDRDVINEIFDYLINNFDQNRDE